MTHSIRSLSTVFSATLSLGALALVGACDATPPEDLGVITPRCLGEGCGVGMNGGTLEGARFPDFDLTGALWSEYTLTSITWDGQPVSAFSVINGVPVSVVGGVAKAGAAAIETRFAFELESGEETRETEVTIVGYELASTGYGNVSRVLLRNTASGEYVCNDGWAILVADAYWDYSTTERVARANTVTIACWDAAIAKATWEFGYDVHDTSASAIALHNIAIKAIRADYCGTGESFTEDGVLIEITDESSINPGPAESIAEVVWGEDGALCLNTPRHVSRALVETTCGHSFPDCDKSPDITEWAGGRLLTGLL